MLPKTERFTTKELDGLRRINPKTKKLNTPYGFFVIHELPEPTGKKGIILTKKIFKTAVLRNKTKRLFYNTILEIKKENQNLNLNQATFLFHPKKVFSKKELIEDLNKISRL